MRLTAPIWAISKPVAAAIQAAPTALRGLGPQSTCDASWVGVGVREGWAGTMSMRGGMGVGPRGVQWRVKETARKETSKAAPTSSNRNSTNSDN